MAFAAVSAMVLSACGELNAGPLVTGSGGGDDPPSKVKVSTPYSGSETVQPGTVVTSTGGGNFAITNRIARGSFSVTLPTRVEVPKGDAKKSGGGIKSVTGTYITKLDGTYTASTNKGQFTGLEVVKFDKSKLGTACLDLSVDTTPSAGNTSTNTGIFGLTGGTKEAKTSRFSGTYSETATGSGSTSTISGTLTGKLKFGKSAHPLSDACKALAAQL